jgi:hypothetical protein
MTRDEIAAAERELYEPHRRSQAEAVMPLIGPLLDAWDGLSNDARDYAEEDSPELARIIGEINRAMEGDD